MRITDLAIRKLPFEANGQKRYRDDTLPGFGLIVGTKSKTFFVMYGRDRRVKTLGHWPTTSLREARQRAHAMLAAPDTKKPSQPNFELLGAFLDDCSTRLRPSTTDRYRFALAHHQDKIDHNTTDPHQIAALKAFYTWAIDRGHLDKNPMANKKAVYQSRDRVLSDDEVAKLFQYHFPPYSDIIKILILTGQRRGQFATFNQSWIRDDCIHFPPLSMKSKRPHILPLTRWGSGVVSQLKPFNGWSKAKVRINKHTGVTDWVVHDTRRYFSSTCARLGVPLHLVELILDHRTQLSGVAAVYNRYSYLPELRNALETYEAHIAKLINAHGP